MNNSQTTNTVFMVLPICFSYNEQTATNNAFQKKESFNTQERAFKESSDYIDLLKKNNINVISVQDTITPITPDSVFPNNWFSTHSDGSFVLYPMYALNRRNERKHEFIDAIHANFKPKRIIDLTSYEKENLFLEGTGSMVLDRINKIAYVCSSPRTSEVVLKQFCDKLGYTYLLFNSWGKDNTPIYHTNVMMSIGSDFAIICLDTIKDINQKNKVIDSLTKTNKKIINVTYEQLEHFACNILEVKNNNNERCLIMSQTAYDSFTKDQIDYFKSICKIIHPSIPTIETNGGGSARCMIAEIF